MKRSGIRGSQSNREKTSLRVLPCRSSLNPSYRKIVRRLTFSAFECSECGHTHAAQGMRVAEAWCNFLEYQPPEDLQSNELTEDGATVFVAGFDPAARRR